MELAAAFLILWLLGRCRFEGVSYIEHPPRPIPRSQLPPGDLRHTLSR